MEEALVKRLEELERRISLVEQAIKGPASPTVNGLGKKQVTLSELIQKAPPKNGHEKVALIVGYHEKILGQVPVTNAQIHEVWLKSKMPGSFKTNLVHDAVRNGLVREPSKDGYDLTMSGEQYFSKYLAD